MPTDRRNRLQDRVGQTEERRNRVGPTTFEALEVGNSTGSQEDANANGAARLTTHLALCGGVSFVFLQGPFPNEELSQQKGSLQIDEYACLNPPNDTGEYAFQKVKRMKGHGQTKEQAEWRPPNGSWPNDHFSGNVKVPKPASTSSVFEKGHLPMIAPTRMQFESRCPFAALSQRHPLRKGSRAVNPVDTEPG